MLNYYLNCYIFLFLSFLFCILLLKYLDSSRCQARQYKKEFLKRYKKILSNIDNTNPDEFSYEEKNKLIIEISYAISQYEFILENASLKQKEIAMLNHVLAKLKCLYEKVMDSRQLFRNR